MTIPTTTSAPTRARFQVSIFSSRVTLFSLCSPIFLRGAVVCGDNIVNTDFNTNIADEWKCAITGELIVDPCIAEYGHVYERKEITMWLASHDTSPRTRATIGRRLVPRAQAKNTIEALVAGGTVEPVDEREWQARRGSLRSEAGDFDEARKSFDRAIELARTEFDTGMVNINGYNLAKPNLPFGGVKDSGYGREHGGFGIREFVNTKAVMVVE